MRAGWSVFVAAAFVLLTVTGSLADTLNANEKASKKSNEKSTVSNDDKKDKSLEPKENSMAEQAPTQIRALLEAQADAWNRGDIDNFVDGYWKSDETEFVGAKGVNKGFQSVLDRYKRDYPDRNAMGHLSFSNLEVHMTCSDSAYVIGEFLLVREKDRPSGFFTLNLKKFGDDWKIIADHTTARAPTQ